METALQQVPPRGDVPEEWSFGEFAVVAGWFFFGCSIVRWVWTLSRWCGEGFRVSPRQPGREKGGEPSWKSPKWAKAEERKEGWPQGDSPTSHRGMSPLRERSARRPVSLTPEKLSRRTPMNSSPEARAVQDQILKAMVQRAQPVVQDLQDMRRLGGLGPGPMLRRGSRLS